MSNDYTEEDRLEDEKSMALYEVQKATFRKSLDAGDRQTAYQLARGAYDWATDMIAQELMDWLEGRP